MLISGFLFILVATAPAADAIHPLKHAVVADMADGSLDDHDLFTAALIISGADDPREIARYQQQLNSLTRRIQQTLHQSVVEDSAWITSNPDAWTSPRQSAQNTAHATRMSLAILQLQHRHLLTGTYDPGCADLRRAFDTGDYNCATATILFHVLARQHDVRAETIGLPGHVCCQLNGWIIETTQANGKIGKIEAPRRAEDEATALSTSRKLTDVQLLAKLFYNQGLQLLASRRFAEALAVTELSWQLDRSHIQARQNVATIINNWALRLCQPGTHEQAITLLQRGRDVAPDFGLLAVNQRHVYLAWHAQALRENDLEKATRIRSTARREFPDIRWPTP